MKLPMLLLWFGLASSLTAIDLGIGLRAGLEGTFHTNQLSISTDGNNTSTLLNKTYTATNFLGSILLHLRFNSWYTLRTAFNVSVNRNVIMKVKDTNYDANNSLLQANHHAFETELLSQFSLGWWYLGLGASLFVSNPLTLTKKATPTPTFDILKHFDHIFWGSNLILETGLNIAIAKSPHTISLALRTALNVESLINQSIVLAPLSATVLIGYTYFFS